MNIADRSLAGELRRRKGSEQGLGLVVRVTGQVNTSTGRLAATDFGFIPPPLSGRSGSCLFCLVADDSFCIGSDDGNGDQDRRPGHGPLAT